MTCRDRSQFIWTFPVLFLLGGCDAPPKCESFETRSAVLQVISNDHRNALVDYAARNSSVAKAETEKSTSSEDARDKPLYQLGERIVMKSMSKDKRTLTCSGSISATVGDTKASKEVNFTVQKSSDGRISVSVAPFQFQVSSPQPVQ
jgi:hypothetical protein